MQNSAKQIDIKDFGAVGDGMTVNTAPIQRAINECAQHGGGSVYVPAGDFVTGTIELKNNVYLELDAGATLLGSTDPVDYRKVFDNDNIVLNIGDSSPLNLDQYLIFAKGAHNIGILGRGTIDAQGGAFYDMEKTRKTDKHKPNGIEYTLKAWRPGPTIAFFDCEQLRIEDITLLNNPYYGVFLSGCTHVWVLKIRIETNAGFINGDGIHIQSSKNITISQCHVDSEDDAICIFTNCWGYYGDISDNCRAITVSDCVLSSSCCGIRIGYSGSGAISDIVFSNIVIKRGQRAIDFICNGPSGYDNVPNFFGGSSIRNIIFTNILANNVLLGITANILPDAQMPACIENIVLSGLRINSSNGNYLVGSDMIPIKNITFCDTEFSISGRLASSSVALPDPAPVFSHIAFSHGLIIRNTEDIRFFNSRILFKPDACGWKSGVFIERSRKINDKGLQIEKDSACEKERIVMAISDHDAQ